MKYGCFLHAIGEEEKKDRTSRPKNARRCTQAQAGTLTRGQLQLTAGHFFDVLWPRASTRYST